MTQIKRISSDKISEDQLNPPNQRSIPPHWSWVKLGDVCEPPQYGYTTSASNNGNLKFLRTTDITSGQIDWDLVPFCKVNPKEIDKYLLKENDVVISRAGSVGYSLLLSKPQRAVFASYLIRFRPKTNPKFFALFLQSPQYWNQISEKKLGIAVPNVNAKKLMDINFPLPPLPEQKKIVEKIEELFSQLESGVASLKKAKEQIRLYRQSVLAAAFSGKLVSEKSLNHDSQDSKINRIKEKNKSGKSDNPENHGSDNLPEGWKWVKLGEVLEVKDGTHDTPKYYDKGIPFITQKNIKNGEFVFDNYNFISEEDHNKFYKRSNVAFNDIIISMIGANRGMSAIVRTKEKFSIKNVGLVKTNESKFLAKYLDYFFKSEIGQRTILSQSKGGAQQFIGLTELRNWSIPFQPLNQQLKIVSEIEKRFSEADNLEKAIDESLAKAETLRQSILKQAFEGKLV